ncbi:apolipophorins isoform X2 [Cephus cinctus]|uniref:Apolipophorins isoform X2 n=1 Tax=Cephus cinctus TaxID=211228 RepID=A0AAJ7VWZ8_CEPCN|nr:apolipophorins isoform X2 [Cephus cinctus]
MGQPPRFGTAALFALLLLLLVTTAIAKQCTTGCHGMHASKAYAEGHTYTYQLEGTSVTSVSDAQGEATLSLSGIAELSIHPDCVQQLKLKNIQINGSPVASHDLDQYGLQFNYHNGHIDTEVCADPNDSQASLNVKRAVVSLFQSAVFKNDGATTHHEFDVFGGCPTDFNFHKEGGSLVVRKYRNLGQCAYRENIKQDLVSSTFNPNSDIKSSPILDSEQKVEQHFKHGILNKAVSTETYNFKPFSKGESGAKTVVVTTLTLKGQKSGVASSSTSAPKSIIFEAPHPVIKSSVETIVSALRAAKEEMPDEVRPPAARKFSELVKVLRTSNKNDILTVYHRVKAGAGFDKHHDKKILLDALYRTGTGEAAEVTVELIRSHEITGVQTLLYYISLSFVRHVNLPSVVAITSLLDQPGLPRQGYLGIGSVIGKYCQEHSCSRVPEVKAALDKIVAKIGDGRAANRDQETVLVAALKALGNTRYLDDVSLEKIARVAANTDLSNRVRAAAIGSLPTTCSMKWKSILLDTLANREDDSEIRIKSYLALVSCPCPHVANKLKEILDRETVNQVGSFVTSHLRNLRASADPDKQEAKRQLGLIKPRTKFPEDFRKFSFNSELSYNIDSLGIGSSAETNVIYSQNSFVPRSTSLNLTTEIFGHSFNFLELEGRVENLDRIIEQYFGPKGRYETADFENLYKQGGQTYEALKKLVENRVHRISRREVKQSDLDKFAKGIQLKDNEVDQDLDIDLSIKLFGAEVAFLSLQEPTKKWTPQSLIDTIFDGIENGIKGAKNFNYHLENHLQFLDAELVYPTGLGLPLSLGVIGSSALHLKTNGKIDLPAILKDPKNAAVQIALEPSAAITIIGNFLVQGFDVQSGLKVVSTLHTATGSDVSLKLLNGNGVDVSFGLPKKKQEIISVSSEVLLSTGSSGENYAAPKFNKDKKHSDCFDQLSGLLGFVVCGEVAFPYDSFEAVQKKALFPLSGPAKFAVTIENTDVSSYHFKLYNNVKSTFERSFEILLETPNSRTNRKLVFLVESGLQPNKYVKVQFDSPLKKASAEAVLKNNDQERTITVSVHNDQIEYFARVGVVAHGSKYKPVLEYKLPEHIEKLAASKTGTKSGQRAGQQQFNVNGLVDVTDVDGGKKFHFDKVALIASGRKLYGLDGTLLVTPKSVSADLKGTSAQDSVAVKLDSKRKNSQYSLELSVLPSKNPDIGALVKWEFDGSPNNLESNLIFVHGRDFNSQVNRLTVQRRAQYVNTPEAFKLAGSYKLKYPALGVELKLEGEVTKKSLSYDVEVKYEKFKLESEGSAKIGISKPTDYEIDFEAKVMENSIELKSKHTVVGEHKSKFENSLTLSPGGKYEADAVVVYDIKPSHTNLQVDAELKLHEKKLEINYSLDSNRQKLNSRAAISLANVKYLDFNLKMQRGVSPSGNFNLNLKNSITATGQFDYQNDRENDGHFTAETKITTPLSKLRHIDIAVKSDRKKQGASGQIVGSGLLTVSVDDNQVTVGSEYSYSPDYSNVIVETKITTPVEKMRHVNLQYKRNVKTEGSKGSTSGSGTLSVSVEDRKVSVASDYSYVRDWSAILLNTKITTPLDNFRSINLQVKSDRKRDGSSGLISGSGLLSAALEGKEVTIGSDYSYVPDFSTLVVETKITTPVDKFRQINLRIKNDRKTEGSRGQISGSGSLSASLEGKEVTVGSTYSYVPDWSNVNVAATITTPIDKLSRISLELKTENKKEGPDGQVAGSGTLNAGLEDKVITISSHYSYNPDLSSVNVDVKLSTPIEKLRTLSLDYKHKISKTSPSFELTWSTPVGKTSALAKFNKLGDKEFTGEWKLETPKGFATADGHISLESVDNFLIKVNFDSDVIPQRKIHAEIANRPTAKTGTRIIVTVTSNGKNILSGSTNYKLRKEDGKITVEGNGSVKLGESTKSSSFKYTRQELTKEADGETGVAILLNTNFGQFAIVGELKLSNKGIYVFNSYCEQSKDCAHFKLQSTLADPELTHLDHQITVEVNLKKFNVPAEFGLKTSTKTEGFTLDHTATLYLHSSKDKTQYTYQVYAHPKESADDIFCLAVILTMPKREVALITTLDVPKNKKHGPYKLDVSLYADRKSHPQEKSTLSIFGDVSTENNVYALNGEARVTYPSQPKEFTVKGRVQYGGEYLLSATLEADVFAKKAQKINVAAHLTNVQVPHGYNVTGALEVTSRGQQLKVDLQQHLAITSDQIGFGSLLWYTDEHQKTKNVGVLFSATLKEIHLLIKAPDEDLVKADTVMDISANIQKVDSEIVIAGVKHAVISFEAHDLQTYNFVYYLKGVPKSKITASGRFSLTQMPQVHAESLESLRNQAIDLAKHLQAALKSIAQEVVTELKDLWEHLKKAQPNLTSLLQHYENELVKLRNELQTDQTVKEIQATLNKSFGGIIAVFVDAANYLASRLEELRNQLNVVTLKLKNAIESIYPQLQESYEKIIKVLIPLYNEFMKTVSIYINAVTKFIAENQKELKEVFAVGVELIQDINKVIGTTIGQIEKDLREFILVLIQQIKTLPISDFIREKYQQALNYKIPEDTSAQAIKEFQSIYIQAQNVLRDFLAKLKSQLTPENVIRFIENNVTPDFSILKKIPGIVAPKISLINLVLNRELPTPADVFYTYRSAGSLADIVPPFPKIGFIADGGQVFTFDGRHVSLTGSCSYILAQDVVDGNFSIVANLENGNIQSITLTEPNESITYKTDGSILVNGRPSEFPATTKNLRATQLQQIINVKSSFGVEILCGRHVPELCSIHISGFYLGKLRGLLGNGNNEPWDDLTLPSGKVAENEAQFGNAYKLSSGCPDAVPAPRSTKSNSLCTEFFVGASSLSGCFNFVDSTPFREACNQVATSSGNTQTACTTATAYSLRCAQIGIFTGVPLTCAGSCKIGSNEVAIGDTFSVKIPKKEADIVFVVEQVTQNEKVFKELITPLLSEVRNELKHNGIKDVHIGVIGYSETSDNPPQHFTYGGSSNIDGEIKNINFEKTEPHITLAEAKSGSVKEALLYAKQQLNMELGTTKLTEAYEEAINYPFRPTAAKAVVGVIATPCEKSPLPLSLQQLRLLLGQKIYRDRGLTYYHISSLEDIKVSGKAQRNIVGYDDESAYTFADSKKRIVEGNADIRNNLNLASNDVCAEFAVSSGGAVFSTYNFLEAKPHQKKQFLQVASRKIASGLVNIELEEDCVCVQDFGLFAAPKCKVTGRKEKEPLAALTNISEAPEGRSILKTNSHITFIENIDTCKDMNTEKHKEILLNCILWQP